MIKQLVFISKFVFVAIIYVILFKIIKVMLYDLKEKKKQKDSNNEDIKGIVNKDVNFALEVLDSPDSININQGTIFPIYNRVTIGRRDDNIININDPYISGHHSEIMLDDGELYIIDLDSTNGTLVNDKLVEGEKRLFLGDTLKVGRVVFKVIG